MSFERQLAAAMAMYPDVSPQKIVSACAAAGEAERERQQQEHVNAELAASAKALQEHEERTAPAREYARLLAEVQESERDLAAKGITLNARGPVHEPVHEPVHVRSGESYDGTRGARRTFVRPRNDADGLALFMSIFLHASTAAVYAFTEQHCRASA